MGKGEYYCNPDMKLQKSPILVGFVRGMVKIQSIERILLTHFGPKGSSINDVPQFWTIFDSPPPSPIITLFIDKALVLPSQNPLTVTSFTDDPYVFHN